MNRYNRLMLIALPVIVALIVTLYLFSSKVSLIPYFPTHNHDIKDIITVFDLKNDHTLMDLGAGMGNIIFTAATEAANRNLKTTFVAIEINIILVAVLYVKRLFHRNKKNIIIRHGNLFDIDYKKEARDNKHVTCYLYGLLTIADDVYLLLKRQIPTARIVFYIYPTKKVKASKTLHKVHDIFVY